MFSSRSTKSIRIAPLTPVLLNKKKIGDDMLTDYHEPSIEYRSKLHGSTTLKQCGWCIYASGTHRYSYCIEGSCSLQKSYSKDIKWDNKCLFINASKSEIKAFIEHHEYDIKNHESSIERHKKYIIELQKIESEAPERPSLPDDRPHDHFNIDDHVAVWQGDKWYFGEVRNGYRHQDGCVSFCLDGIGPQEANDKEFPFKEGFWGLGVSVPIILLKSEYDFFKDNQKEYDIWCEKAYSKSFNGKTLEPVEIK
jgi:hypothetical protein